MLLSTLPSRDASASRVSARASRRREISETGRSNSIQERHWSDFNFPCPFSPRLLGGPSCHVGRVVLRMSSWTCRSSCRVNRGTTFGATGTEDAEDMSATNSSPTMSSVDE